MSESLRRVVKLGGSLLDWPRLAEAWQRWLVRQPAAQTLVVVGGGGVVDVIADLQQLNGRISDEAAHWLCIRAMQLNAELMVGLLPAVEYVADVVSFAQRPIAVGAYVVDPWAFMQVDARGPRPLPESWDVTSDAIAARLAETIDADELVLLKSKLPDPAQGDESYVDRAFVETSRAVPAIRFVNLRDEAFPEWRQK